MPRHLPGARFSGRRELQQVELNDILDDVLNTVEDFGSEFIDYVSNIPHIIEERSDDSLYVRESKRMKLTTTMVVDDEMSHEDERGTTEVSPTTGMYPIDDRSEQPTPSASHGGLCMGFQLEDIFLTPRPIEEMLRCPL